MLTQVRRFKSSRLRSFHFGGSYFTGPGGIAPVAQRIEHLTTDQKVGGSNPSGRTNKNPSLGWVFRLGLAVPFGEAFQQERIRLGFCRPVALHRAAEHHDGAGFRLGGGGEMRPT